ncbi:hypothetical protein DFJ73DRAFT_815711 [Zopfochytrium polystomum]|nr:hypothetical protein DFJ73DRAFT_815711 [Zopfochytrium polystomum]
MSSGRFQSYTACLGDAWTRATTSSVLMVGAGGIGCELLKNLVMCSFGKIEIMDLDTIDVSNLNRQFLFQRQHVKKPKAVVARESALQFNPHAQIIAHHDSIFSPVYDVEWFRRFDIVLNALDNIAARRHVNMMCLAAGVPLVESGTAGYNGQVTVHHKNTRCYDCEPKPTPKTFPVCTIRSTPSTPIHCIVWAKNYLLPQLFGKDEEEGPIESGESEDTEEIAKLKKEALILKSLRESLPKQSGPRDVFEQVFTRDIERIAAMSDMWKLREPPVPLSYVSLAGELATVPNGAERDQEVWSIAQNFSVFEESARKLAKRLHEGQSRVGDAFTISFDKDDDDTMDFVASVANLRAASYGIEMQSRFKAKEMAGNIIPAIATTNAIIAGLILIEAFKVLGGSMDNLRETYVVCGTNQGGTQLSTSLIMSEPIANEPVATCSVCRAGYFTLEVDTAGFTLGDFVEKALRSNLGLAGDLSISEGKRLLYDADFDDNAENSLQKLQIKHSSRLTVMHEDEKTAKEHLLQVFVIERSGTGKAFSLNGDRNIPVRIRPAEPSELSSEVGKGKKRVVAEDIDGGVAKKYQIGDDVGVVDITGDDEEDIL